MLGYDRRFLLLLANFIRQTIINLTHMSFSANLNNGLLSGQLSLV